METRKIANDVCAEPTSNETMNSKATRNECEMASKILNARHERACRNRNRNEEPNDRFSNAKSPANSKIENEMIQSVKITRASQKRKRNEDSQISIDQSATAKFTTNSKVSNLVETTGTERPNARQARACRN